MPLSKAGSNSVSLLSTTVVLASNTRKYPSCPPSPGHHARRTAVHASNTVSLYVRRLRSTLHTVCRVRRAHGSTDGGVRAPILRPVSVYCPKRRTVAIVTLPSECVSLNRPGFEDLIHPRHRRGRSFAGTPSFEVGTPRARTGNSEIEQ